MEATNTKPSQCPECGLFHAEDNLCRFPPLVQGLEGVLRRRLRPREIELCRWLAGWEPRIAAAILEWVREAGNNA